MDFRTRIDIKPSTLKIDHRSQVMMFGSCFAQSVGDKLLANKFCVNVNPFGILYNPASISTVIRRIIDGRLFTLNDVNKCNDIFISFLHHGDFSALTAQECVRKINESLTKAAEDLRRNNLLVITFGTSYIYQLAETAMTVSNCHKFPASTFVRKRLSADEITEDWTTLISQLKSINPHIKIVLTVSPVRHWKDGAHENQLSKSILHLAIDQIQKKHDATEYFPSYEILMDELRDYRFYADDMIHPNKQAIDYIWEVFSNTYFNLDTKNINIEWHKIAAALSHKPFNCESARHKDFLRQTLLRLDDFQNKYPYINCSKERSYLTALLA